jgi:hypothetical protein
MAAVLFQQGLESPGAFLRISMPRLDQGRHPVSVRKCDKARVMMARLEAAANRPDGG